jgi:hypothetical protein
VSSNERKRLLMQQALDAALSPELRQELDSLLESDQEEAAHFSRLKQVDALLSAAPFERAPQRLAVTIMARLAQTVTEAQQMQEEPELNEATLQVAMTLVTVATLPLLVGASWLLLNALSSAELLESVLHQITLLLILVIDVMKVMIEEAQALFASNPEAAIALLALIPLTLLTIVKEILGENDKTDKS